MKKTFLKVISAFAFLFVVVIVFLYFLGIDDAPESDDDLTRVRSTIQESENAFQIFMQASQKLDYPDDAEKGTKIDNMINKGEWDQEFASELIEKNAESLSLLSQGLALPHLQLPEDETFEYETSHAIRNWRKVAQILSVQAISLGKNGKQEEALTKAFDIIMFGKMIENSKGFVMHYLIGRSCAQVGLATIKQILPGIELTNEEIKQYIEKLHAYRDNTEGLKNAFRRDYVSASHTIDELANGDYLGSLALRKRTPWRIWVWYMYQPNKTKKALANHIRESIHYADLPCNNKEIQDLVHRNTLNMSDILSGFDFILPNIYGKQMLSIFAMNYGKFYIDKCEEHTLVAETQILFALKGYFQTHGSLPLTLDELVPAYFDSIPQDGFDDQSIRYSVEDKLIYSIGLLNLPYATELSSSSETIYILLQKTEEMLPRDSESMNKYLSIKIPF